MAQGYMRRLGRVLVRDNGSDVGNRTALNFIEGTNVTLTIADDAVNDEVDVTINASATPRDTLAYSYGGALVQGGGDFRLPMNYAGTIVSVRAMVNTPPTGSSAVFDVNKNGVTIFTTQGNRPTIAASGTDSGSAIPDVTTFTAGDYFSVDVDDIGSTTAGSDAVIVIVVEPS